MFSFSRKTETISRTDEWTGEVTTFTVEVPTKRERREALALLAKRDEVVTEEW